MQVLSMTLHSRQMTFLATRATLAADNDTAVSAMISAWNKYKSTIIAAIIGVGYNEIQLVLCNYKSFTHVSQSAIGWNLKKCTL